MSKRVRLTTLHGLRLPLVAITSDSEWFLDKIEKTPRNQYMQIFRYTKMNKREYTKVYQDEHYTDIIVTDIYGKKIFLEIKE